MTPPGIPIQPFRWTDLDQFTDLFNEVNGISRSEKAYDRELMRQFLSQPSCKPEENCFLAKLSSSLVGYVLIAPELPIARAVASGGVLESHRNRGIGRRLVGIAVERAKALTARVLHIQTSPNDEAGHRILRTAGFSPVKRFWGMRWERGPVPPVELPDGFSLRSLRLGRDEEGLTHLQNACFGENWGFSPNTKEEIDARVRMNRCDPEGIIFIVDSHRPSAFNWTLRSAALGRSTGWIAMTGVHPDFRNRGMGRAVLVAGMQYLSAKGVDGIELEVDSENAPAIGLYLRLGFRRLQETIWYERLLGGESEHRAPSHQPAD